MVGGGGQGRPLGGQGARRRGGLAQDAVDGRDGRHLAGVAQALAEQRLADLGREQRRPLAL